MRYMQLKKCLALALSLILFWACVKEEFESAPQSQGVVVGFYADGSAGTRTTINDDGVSTSWSTTDRLALWALNESTQAYTLNNTPFKVYFRDTSTSAFFTATLDAAMPEASYTYYATYPTPASVNGTTATFVAPATQDGKMGGGAAIMVATPQSGIGALDIITDRSQNDELMDGNLHMSMNHKMHALRMFIPDIDTKRYYGFGDEKVERIELTMPWDIAGTVNTDIADPAAGLTLTGNGSKTITLNLQEPIGATTASGDSYDYDYAYASIIPAPNGDVNIYNGQLEAIVYGTTKAAKSTISLANFSSTHSFSAGHITPVILNCSDIRERHAIRLKWEGNNLGEDIHTIYFYDAAGTEVYRITDVASFVETGIHDIDYTFNDSKDAILSSLAGQTLTVKYESEHAIVSNTIVMPLTLATEVKCHEIGICAPYLFFEDFSRLSGYDINGGNVSTKERAGSSLTDNFFTPGWTGNQTSGQQGNAIRLRTRTETLWGIYNSRVDSAPMAGLKDGASVNVVVSFDYAIAAELENDDCMSFSYGYTTTQGAIEAHEYIKYLVYETTKGNHIDNAITVKIPSTSYITYPGNDVYPTKYETISKFEIQSCTKLHRLSWEMIANGHAVDSKNHWLYLDNIKVQIVSE